MNTKSSNYNGRNHCVADVLQENSNHPSKQVNLLAAELEIIHNSKRSFNQLSLFNRGLNPGQVSFGNLTKIIFLLYASIVLASAVDIENYATESQNRLYDDCIEDIKAQKFQDAMIKFLKMNNSEINLIIKKVYNNQEENFDLLLNFANNITHVPQNFLIYSGLYFEMSTNGHTNNPFHFISLAKGLKTEVIDQPWYSKSDNSKYKTQAEKMMNDIVNKIRKLSNKLIKQAMLPGKAHSSDPLVTQIEKLNDDLLRELATDLVNDFISTTDTQVLISLVDEHFTSYWLTIFCFTTIYNRMPRDDPAIFELTRRVKRLLNPYHYPDLNSQPTFSSCKSEYEKLKNRIPEAVRNIVYADSVCIKNVYYNEYLFASNYSHESVENKRLVFTRKTLNTTNQNLNQYKWIFENERSNIFRIKNVHFPGYMYASSKSFNLNEYHRHVFNSMPDNEVASNWKIIPKEDHFHLLNMDKNEYLHADTKDFSDSTKENRHVYTNMLGLTVYDGEWKIEKNC